MSDISFLQSLLEIGLENAPICSPVPTALRLPAGLLTQLPEGKNSVISPFGIKAVLGLAANGGSGQGLREILDVLEVPDLQTLNLSIENVSHNNSNLFRSDCSVRLPKDTAWNPTFLDNSRTYYRAEVQGSSDSSTLTLKNVADFQGTWHHKFSLDRSGTHIFHNADHSIATPPFLELKPTPLMYYSSNPDLQAVSIPYRVGNDHTHYEMTFVLTDKTPDLTTLSHIFQKRIVQNIRVLVPKFHLKCTWHNLIVKLQSLGISELFDYQTTDFCGFNSDFLYASRFEQDTEINLDENGTQAHAATTMVLMGGIIPENTPDPKYFIADRPFYYFLHGTKKGEILFEGKISQL